MADVPVCLEGIVSDILFRNDANGFTVLSLQTEEDEVTAVGILPFLAAGEQVRLYGTYATHAEYGRQLKVERYETVAPTTKEGIERYLITMVDGVGPATAKMIVARFGLDTLDTLQYAPEQLRRISGIGPKRAARIAASFRESYQVQQIMLFLQRYGVTPSLAMKIYQRYGNDAITAVRQNPYQLIEDVDGIGFRTADAIAREMGVAADAPLRLHAAIRHVLSLAMQEGHVCQREDALLRACMAHLAMERAPCEMALQSLLLSRKLIAEDIGGEKLIYLPFAHAAETDVAARLLRLGDAAPTDIDGLERIVGDAQSQMGFPLSGEQRRAVMLCAAAPLAIVTGGPGTGKTTLIRCLLHVLERSGCAVKLCAPTGRAAKRMSEATSREASTIHRLLEFSFAEGGSAFQRGEDRPLEADVLIVDEVSMVDLFLMRALLQSLREGARLILVGDADQLPSVGAGNVLHDIISSAIFPTIALTQIHRQAEGSMIARNAQRIRSGEMPVLNERDFYFLSAASPVQAADTVIDLCRRRLPARFGLDPLKDIQVLCPMHKGEAGVSALGNALQTALNPPDVRRRELHAGGRLFREGDKVMQMKNDYQLRWRRSHEDGEGVFNGDGGWIDAIDEEESSLRVAFDDGRVATYERETLGTLEKAYAISVHKSQGCEFPVVVLVLMGGPPTLLTRNLLYTAVTRAKTLAIIVGRPETLALMVNNRYVASRCGALRARLTGKGARL